MKIEISQRDKKLLLLLLIVIIICLPYFLLAQPTMEKNEGLEKEIATLKDTRNQLEQWALNADNYRQEMEDIAWEKEILFGRYPSELPQEANIIFIYTTERAIPIKLYQVSFGENVAAQITSEAEEAAIKEVEAATGDVTDSEVIAEVTETTSLGGGLQGISTSTQFTFTAGYQEFKDFLAYIANYKDRMVITELNASYSEDGSINGSFKLTQYAIAGSERTPVQFLPPAMIQGTTNIFMQATGNLGSFEETVEQADFFLMLSQPDATMDAKIIGRANDPSEDTYLTSDDNNEQEITITFEGENGAYTASYSIAKKTYSGDEITFEKDGSIYFEIISSPRVGDKDKVAAKINIVNRTDTTVNVKVLDDDLEKPRVNIMGKTGAILMK